MPDPVRGSRLCAPQRLGRVLPGVPLARHPGLRRQRHLLQAPPRRGCRGAGRAPAGRGRDGRPVRRRRELSIRARASGHVPSARPPTTRAATRCSWTCSRSRCSTWSMPVTPTSCLPGWSAATPSSSARSSRSRAAAPSPSSSVVTTPSPGPPPARWPRCARRGASASSTLMPTPTPPTTIAACSPATALPCAGSSSRVRWPAATSCRSGCEATGRRPMSSSG